MSDEPDFSNYIAAGKREAAARAQLAEVERLKRATEKLRAEAEVIDVLNHVVLPLLTSAQEGLHAAGMVGDVGNGCDSYGALRRSLRISRPDLEHSPVIVFTAVMDGPKPYLGWHSETFPRPGGHIPQPVTDISQENLTRVIGEFLKSSI